MAVKQQPAPETFDDKLAAIIARAPALRAAGVLTVGGDVSFTLAPPDPPPPRGPEPEEEPDLDDVAAYRKGRGGKP